MRRSEGKVCRTNLSKASVSVIKRCRCFVLMVALLLVIIDLPLSICMEEAYAPVKANHENAYATMLYMGGSHDYEFFVAARVLLRSLADMKVDADLVAIVSKDVPERWINTLTSDGVRVLLVDNIKNPYSNQPKFNKRFMFTLNKIYAWSLVEYKRVVMLDADNLFLRKTDELFLCGQFCAAFIDPCYFHTGLFVLEPSMETFEDLLREIKRRRRNKDGADQGFLISYFDNLLERPFFIPPANGSKLSGFYRLPFGYQMDAVFFYLRLKWHVPCGPNSVITFPSLPLMKPWYWWSWPVLPLGLAWHEQRRITIGYGSQVFILAIEALCYVITLIMAIIVQRYLSPSERTLFLKPCMIRGLCYEQLPFFDVLATKTIPILAVAGSFLLPFFLVPTTSHPLIGWSIFLLGSMSFSVLSSVCFQYSLLAGMTPWFSVVGGLLALACPFYSNGIIRVICIALYGCLVSSPLWWALTEISASRGVLPGREPLMAHVNPKQEAQFELTKIC